MNQKQMTYLKEENQMEQQQPNNENQPVNPMEEYQRELDRNEEAKHEAATTIAEKMCDMMGIEDPTDRVNMVEGYRALFSGGPRFPKQLSMPVMMEPPKLPDSWCTTIETDEEDGERVIVLDWACVLQHAYRQVLYPKTMTMIMNLYNKSLPVRLSRDQTIHLLRWLKAIDDIQTRPGALTYGPMIRIPRELLSHPEVVKVLGEANYVKDEVVHNCCVYHFNRTDEWAVGVLDDENVEHLTTFTGPDAEHDAREFADKC